MPASFKSLYHDGGFTVAPDDKTLYFSSRRAKESGENASEDTNIWRTEITAQGWSKPIMLKAPGTGPCIWGRGLTPNIRRTVLSSLTTENIFSSPALDPEIGTSTG